MKKAVIIILILGIAVGGVMLFINNKKDSTLDVDKGKQEEFFNNFNDISKERSRDKRFINKSGKDVSFEFNKAHKINKETIGAIYIPKTSILFPIVKHKDNDYYLHHTFYNNYSIRGAIFMDFNQTFDDKHTMIYGHNLSSGDMFSELTNYSSQGFAKSHQIVYIWNKNIKKKYKVFSSFVTSRTDYDTYKLGFSSNNYYQKWLDRIKDRSTISYNLKPTNNKKTITLSTCTDNTHRQTIHLQEIK